MNKIHSKALQQKRATKKNLKRYFHTKSFGMLSGHGLEEVRDGVSFRRKLSQRETRIYLVIFFIFFWSFGVYSLFF